VETSNLTVPYKISVFTLRKTDQIWIRIKWHAPYGTSCGCCG